MTTQSLRTLPGTGRLHWRADRLGLADFNQAFVGLMGLSAQLPDSEMTAFNQFVSALVYPPNPAQHLDRSMPDAPRGQPSAKRGKAFFFDRPVDCRPDLQLLPQVAERHDGQVINKTQLMGSQDMKTPQLRNLYKKTGFTDAPGALNKRGFGFAHDGSFDTIFQFLKRPNFEFDPGPDGDLDRRDVEAFVLAFDTGTPPSVGARSPSTRRNRNQPALIARIDTLRSQAAFGFCDIIARGTVGGQPRGWWYQNDGTWRPTRRASPRSRPRRCWLSRTREARSASRVPVASGERMGNDRDRDGTRDGDELDAGSDPGNGASHPTSSNHRPSVEAGRTCPWPFPSSAKPRGRRVRRRRPGLAGGARHSLEKSERPGNRHLRQSERRRHEASFSQAGSIELASPRPTKCSTTTDAVTVTVTSAAGGGQVDRRVAGARTMRGERERSGRSPAAISSCGERRQFQTVGIRFTGIDIPQGAGDHRRLRPVHLRRGPVRGDHLRIQGSGLRQRRRVHHREPRISSRPRTECLRHLDTPRLDATNVGDPPRRTPALRRVVQAIVDRPGWLGRSLALVITAPATAPRDRSTVLATGAARLHVDYVCGSANHHPWSTPRRSDFLLRSSAPATGGGSLESVRGGVTIEHDIPSTTSAAASPTRPARSAPPVVSVWRQTGGPPAVSSWTASRNPPSSPSPAPDLRIEASPAPMESCRQDAMTVRVNVMYHRLERKIARFDDAENRRTGAFRSPAATSTDAGRSSALSAVGLRFPTSRSRRGRS